MPKTIFVTRTIPHSGIRLLTEKGYSVDSNLKNRTLSKRELIRHLKQKPYDAILSLLTDKIDADVFDAAPTVKMVANYATGFDNIDLPEASRRNITVTNAPAAASAEAVAEHALALMLAAAARIVEADSYMRKGKYKGWSPSIFIGSNILGKTLALVGVGRIGSTVARYAKGLGLSVIYTDVARNESVEQETGAVYHPTIETLLPKADIVSIHVPLMESTHHLINEEKLHLMKRNCILVNTSRGPVVDEAALLHALRKGWIGYAALDVFEHEPKLTPGLKNCSNVILTPHIASASVEAREEMAIIAARNIIQFFNGETPMNAVAKK